MTISRPLTFMMNLLRQAALSIFPLMGGILVALVLIVAILYLEDTNPSEFWDALYNGAWAEPSGRSRVITTWMPLLLASSGLLLTFSAGLWNIGIEGQFIMGAVGASLGALFLEYDSYTLQITVQLALAMAAGAAWGLLTAILKTRGGVNEIFGGVAMNFIALGFSSYLISGPWMPPVGGTGSRTAPFDPSKLLNTIAVDVPFPFDFPFREIANISEYRFLTPVAVYIGIGSFLLVAVILYFTRFGLQLKALGKSPASARALGIPTERNIWLSMAMCGGLAGLAGAVRVLHISTRALQANPSGGTGFLALLVVLLVAFRPWLVPLISFAFSFMITGALRVETTLQIDSSLVNVLQGVLVFFVLLFDGVRQRIQEQQEKRAVAAEAARLAQSAEPPPDLPPPDLNTSGDIHHE